MLVSSFASAGRIVEDALDFIMERGLVVLDGQEIVGLVIDDVLSDFGVAGDGIDGDQRAGQGTRVGQAFQEQLGIALISFDFSSTAS